MDDAGAVAKFQIQWVKVVPFSAGRRQDPKGVGHVDWGASMSIDGKGDARPSFIGDKMVAGEASPQLGTGCREVVTVPTFPASSPAGNGRKTVSTPSLEIQRPSSPP